MVVVSWWWSVVYNMSYFAMNMIVFYIRDRNLFFSLLYWFGFCWVRWGGMNGFGMGGIGAGGLRGLRAWIWGCG